MRLLLCLLLKLSLKMNSIEGHKFQLIVSALTYFSFYP